METGIDRGTVHAGGYPPDVFSRLAAIEPGHYWFESRNLLLIWTLRRYFPRASTMLEVGCGSGFVLQGLHAAFPDLQLTGYELFPEGLDITRARVATAALVQGDARELDLGQRFDVVGAFDVLEHITEDVLVMRRMFDSLRPGGGVLITVPQHPGLWSRADDYGRHVRRYRRRELVDRLRQVGFEIVHITSFVSLPLPAMALSRWIDQYRRGDFDPWRELHVSPSVNRLLGAILAAERWAIKIGVSWPAGGSLLAIGRRPVANTSLA